MFLGFGDEKFRALLATKDKGNDSSIYLNLSASFVHFILVQFLALLAAIAANAFNFYMPLPDVIAIIILWGGYVFNCLGYFLFLYSITSMLAAAMAVFRTCSWYEMVQQENNQD